MFVLDTNTVLDYFRGRERVAERLLAIPSNITAWAERRRLKSGIDWQGAQRHVPQGTQRRASARESTTPAKPRATRLITPSLFQMPPRELSRRHNRIAVGQRE